MQIARGKIARREVAIAVDPQPASWQRTGLADVVEHPGVGKTCVRAFAQAVAEFAKDPRDSCSGVPWVEFVSKTIGQLAGHSEVIIEVGNRERPVGIERMSLSPVAAAAGVESEVNFVPAAALG